MMEVIVPMLSAGLTAAVYGAYGYLTGKLGDTGMAFDEKKLVGTALVGFVVGIVASYMGMDLAEASTISILATIGAVEVGQKLLKPVFNWFAAKFTTPAPA